MDLFHSYRPLSPDSIRLLRLLPSEERNAPIQCQLIDYSLQKPGRHPYDALSYVWGSTDNPRFISVGKHDLPVTENLHKALSHLRYDKFERILWVDALCINQEDEREKERQIPLMPRIYGQATSVIVWLGEAADNSDLAIEEIRAAGARASNDSFVKDTSSVNRTDPPENTFGDTISWGNNSSKAPGLHYDASSCHENGSVEETDSIEEIHSIEENNLIDEIKETTQPAIFALFQRPWFQRIWVLQEVAAAQHVLIMCGSTEIDGFAFCLGVDSLNVSYETRGDLHSLIHSVAYLIRGSIFRPNYVTNGFGKTSRAICPLGELIDMYHTHKATKRHDKVFALLGMSSDDLSRANLLPDYSVPWEELLQRIAEFLFTESVSVATYGRQEVAIITIKGFVLGQVYLAESNSPSHSRQRVHVHFENPLWSQRYTEKQRTWTFQQSAKPIQNGDFICLLQGASKPTIIRFCKNYFAIIMIAASPLEDIGLEDSSVKWPSLLQRVKDFNRNFSLVWDWENSSEKLQGLGIYKSLESRTRESAYSRTELEDDIDKATEAWDLALILGDVNMNDTCAVRMRKKAIDGYKRAFKTNTYEWEYEDLHCSGLTQLSWASRNGLEALVRLLLSKDSVDPNLKDNNGRTPLSWAAEGGCAVVQLLLENGKVEVDTKDNDGRTPLLWAAKRGNEAIVKLLLETGKTDVNVKVFGDGTPLSWAARLGHEAMLKLLLKADKVDVNKRDGYGWTPLCWATEKGNEAIVKLILETGKADINAIDKYGQAAFMVAAMKGREAVIKLLLETGKVDINLRDDFGWTPLMSAVKGGHEAVVKLLLETGRTDINAKNECDRTALMLANEQGHKTIINLLRSWTN